MPTRQPARHRHAVWQASGSGIPSIPINAFAIDPLNSNNLYAGTDIGVYFSTMPAPVE
jgi:hypothetical protein